MVRIKSPERGFFIVNYLILQPQEKSMKKLKYYIISFRLRTLPLSVSGILMGSLLACANGYFNTRCFLLAIATTLSLQILSNLANELGDLKKGTDNEQRLGPIRSIQSGVLTISEFTRVIILFAFLSLILGSILVYDAFHTLLDISSILMLLAGGAAVIAAIKYTVGQNAYGYRGLGDLFVFIFFGLLSTAGSWFLMTHELTAAIFLPASAIGLLSTGVLNMNNIRDIENDKNSGKRTIPVIIGEKNAKLYQLFLIGGAQLCMIFYASLHYNGIAGFAFLLTLPLCIIHLNKVFRLSGRALDPQLKFVSITTLLFALLGGFGQIW